MSHDAIVIGTGAVGSAALWALARRGVKALGLDRFPAGHDRGSSHGETRVIRQAYFEHPDYVPLLRRSYRLWAELEDAVSSKLFTQTGLVQVGAAEGEVVTGVLRAAEQHGLAVERLSSDEARVRFPMLRVPEDAVAVFESTGGVLAVEDCVRALIAAATRLGAEHRVESVASWRATEAGVEVETALGTHRAARLIIAGGAWSMDLLAEVPTVPPLHVLRKPLYWFAGASTAWDAGAGAPVFLYDSPEGIFYGFPSFEPGVIKVAEHTGGESVTDPMQVDRSERPAETSRVRDFVARSLVGAGTSLQRHAVCMYTMSPDQHFIVDRHPDHPTVVFAAGLSGHGFKMATVLGEALVELALDGASPQPIEFLAARRFRAS